MRNFLFSARWGGAVFGGGLALILAVAAVGRAADTREVSLAAWLPEDTLAFHEDAAPAGPAAHATAMERFYRLPAMDAFRAEIERVDRLTVENIARDAQLTPEEVESVFRARRAFAMLDVNITGDGSVRPTLAALLRFADPPDPQRLRNAIRAYANQPRYVELARQRGIPLNKICWEENWPEAGVHPVLLLAGDPPVRIVCLEGALLVYYGPAEHFRRVLALAEDPTSGRSLIRSGGFQAAWRGSGAAESGGAFFYANAARLSALMAAAGQERISRFLEEIGLDSVHALGLSGAASGDAWRHVLYLYTPGPRTGLLAAARPGVGGAETYAGYLPADSGYAFAGRLDWKAIWEELPGFIAAMRRFFDDPTAFPKIDRALKANAFGVPLIDLLDALGDDMAIVDAPDGPVLRFDAAKLDVLADIERRVEQHAGYPFQTLSAGRFEVRYLNRANGTLMPVAPSWSVFGVRQDNPNRGAVLLGIYPQALISLLGNPPAGMLSGAADFAAVAQGVGPGQSTFMYLDNRASYRRVYNAMLPVASLLTSTIPGVSVNPALLPPGSALEPYLSGCGIGLKSDETGLALTVRSPMGAGGLLVSILDLFVIDNPRLVADILSMLPSDPLGAALENP